MTPQASEAVRLYVRAGIGEAANFTVRNAVSPDSTLRVCSAVRDRVELCTLSMYHGLDRATALAFWELEA